MTPIQLVNGGEALIDDDDFGQVSTRAWRANYRYSCGKRTGISNVVSGSVADGTYVVLHRFLMGSNPGEVVDHADGNPLNNCRANLRTCTHAQNMRNRKIASSNRSGFKGVYQECNSSLYRAEIRCNGIRYNLGRFQTAKQAHEAYAAAAARLHGEFARVA